jgi:hypothetical protein
LSFLLVTFSTHSIATISRRSHMAVLEHDGSAIHLGADTTIGSGTQAVPRIQGKDLAARHFVVRVDPAGGAMVAPSGEACVVTVDGMQVPRSGTPLRDGAVIAAGQAMFVYGAGEQAPQVTPAVSSGGYLIDTTSRRAYQLSRRTVQIGRDAGAGIVLKDPTVSRFHADVRSEAGGYVLYSSGATGAFVNEEEVSRPRLLQNGDEVRIGRITLAFTTIAPPGMKLHTPGGAEESAMTRRSTQLDMRAYREDNGSGSRWSSTPVLLGVVALLLAAIAFLLLQ